MNKLIHRIYKLRHFSWLIAFFLGGIFYTSTVKASNLVIDPSSFSTIQYGAQSLFDLSFLDNGLFSASDWNGFSYGGVLLNDIFSFDSSDMQISELSMDQKITLMDSLDIYYNDNGNYAPFQSNQSLYVANFDNGFFSGQVYLDENGHIISSSPSLDNSLISYKFGGSEYSLNDFITLVDDISNDVISSDSLTIDSNFNPVDNVSYYSWVGSSVSGKPSSAWSLYIANQYDPGYVFAINTTGAVKSWYANSLSPFVYKQTNAPYGEDNRFSYTTGNYTYNGYSYRYLVSYNVPVYNTIADDPSKFDNYDDWINRRIQSTKYWFAQIGVLYDSSKENNGKTFNPYLVENGKAILTTDAYSYGSITDAYEEQQTVVGVLNPDYDNTQSIGDTNFPIYFPTDVSLSDSFPYPIEENPALTYDETIQPELSVAIDSFQNMDIPFITNLQNRYPFSIPWDIAKFINRFRNTPTPPAWNFDWNITVGSTTYTKHFEGDLSDFNSLAEIFRNLVLISFIIALCKFSYDHHF